VSEPVDVEAWSCPLPLRDRPTVVLGHGGGGTLSAELVEHLFLPAFGTAAATAAPTDAAVLALPSGERLAFTTDAHVVQPLEFPGGDIGSLAVHGTVNDLVMVGAVPLALSTAFVLEEGLAVEVLGRLAASMGRAARAAGVALVTGDTKVVEAGSLGGLQVTTSGVGLVPAGVELTPTRIRPGDVVVVSGPIGRHGIAVLSRRQGLDFGTEVTSDSAPLAALVAAMVATGADLHCLRDLTRGGLAAALDELAVTAGVGIEVDDDAVPVPDEVRAACDLFGLDPWEVANEGTMIAVVAPADAEAVVAAMRAVPEGRGAVVVGQVTDEHPATVVARTPLGAHRLVPRPLGEQLPRIC